MNKNEKAVCARACAALKVIELDQRINQFLNVCDPQALRQVQKAVRDLEALGIVSDPHAKGGEKPVKRVDAIQWVRDYRAKHGVGLREAVDAFNKKFPAQRIGTFGT